MAADKKSKKLDKTDKATDKQTALENALKQIEKQYGAGAIMRLGEADVVRHVIVQRIIKAYALDEERRNKGKKP